TWIEEFKKYLLIEKQYSDETLKAYSEDLQHFVDFIDETGGAKSFKEIGSNDVQDRKSTRLNSSHVSISYAVFCLKKKKNIRNSIKINTTQGRILLIYFEAIDKQ